MESIVRRSLVGFAVLASVVLLCSSARAEEAATAVKPITGKHGTIYLPPAPAEGAKAREYVPLLVVLHGVLSPEQLESVSTNGPACVVETTQWNPLLTRRRDGGRGMLAEIERAAGEACKHVPQAKHGAWSLVAGGGSGSLLGRLWMANRARYQGLVFPGVVWKAPQIGKADLKGLHVLLMHPDVLEPEFGDDIPLAEAQGVEKALAGMGATVRLHKLAAKDASVDAAATTKIAEFMSGLSSVAVPARVVASLSASPNDFMTVATASGTISMTGDVYEAKTKKDPLVILFHQARSSRGEYRRIAPTLVAAGYNCLAIDARSGDTWENVRNETAHGAKAKKLPDGYHDARGDLERAIVWARELGFRGRIAIVGSSYSSALVLGVGQASKQVTSIVSFSPGDYINPKGSTFAAAKALTKPVLVIAPKSEEARAKEVFGHFGSKGKTLLVQEKGVHGASTLYRSADSETAWSALMAFLEHTLKNTKAK